MKAFIGLIMRCGLFELRALLVPAVFLFDPLLSPFVAVMILLGS